MKLFESDDDDVEKLSEIQVNEEFARRFEHNKKREDLQRFEELKKKGLVDEDESSDDSEDEDDINNVGEEVSKKDAKFFDALIKIKRKDPILQNKEAKLFESESDSEADSEADDEKKASAKKKPMYLKDVVSKHLIEEGPEFDDEDEDEDEDEKRVKTYSEEQEELRKEFLEAVEKAEMEAEQDGDDIFKVKESGNRGDEDENFDDAENEDGEFSKKLEEYFGEDEKLDENDRFLKDFFRNKMWLDRDDKDMEVEDDEKVILSEDEEALEKQEDYEREFNFRFEENAGDRVLGHARKVEGSVRKKSNARKLQRERKEERIAREKEERKEELKRLKNLKKKEMNEKLQKIKEIAGIKDDVACLLDEDDLEVEFNPEQHDSKMNKTFGDDYYNAEDPNPDFTSGEDDDNLEKPDFAKEDELLGLPAGWDEVNQGEIDDSEDEDHGPIKDAKEKLMDEYYKLDYEDVIGDLKTRFKYKPVKPKKFGLKTEELLVLDDKDLNQYVPLKTLAPYRETEWKVPQIKRYQQKQRVRELWYEAAQKHKAERHEKKNKKKGREMGTSKAETSTENGGDDGNSNLSRKKRRRLRQADLKLSRQRLLAYGKK